MNKRTKTKPEYNGQIVERLISKYGVTKRFISMSLSGDRKSETSDTIASDYKKMEKAVNDLLATL